MRKGSKVEYAIHDISWQDDGSHVPVDDEDWVSATVMAVETVEHPELLDGKEEIVQLDDDEQPPFWIKQALVRTK
jgi:hypothetical protein